MRCENGRREEGCCEQRPTLLLEDHGEFEEPESGSPVRLGDRHRLPAHLCDLRPQIRRMALGRTHQPADGFTRRFVVEPLADVSAEFFLILVEREVHVVPIGKMLKASSNLVLGHDTAHPTSDRR